MSGRTTVSIVTIAGGLVLSGSASAQVLFTEQTTEAGLTMTHQIPEWTLIPDMTGGVSVGDFNRDGWPDLYLASGGIEPSRLFINNGDGTFTDRAAEFGLADTFPGNGAAVGDYDNDGWLDIYAISLGTTSGQQRGNHKLYHNLGGTAFEEVAEAAGVESTSTARADGTGSAFGDYDLDGDLDLFVAGWRIDNEGNRLFRNNGDGTFTDVTVEAGVYRLALRGFDPRFTDLDGDRYPELTVVGDYNTSRYYKNNGDGTFTDYTTESGTGLDDNGMGSIVADFDRDGLPDWFVTSIYNVESAKTGDKLYMNQGDHVFAESATPSGVADGGWGWGTTAGDFNLDGWVDIAQTNGWYTSVFGLFPSRMYVNNCDGTFTDVAGSCGFDLIQGRGIATLDYDRDGDLDIVVQVNRGPLRLFRNDTDQLDRRWIRILLDTSGSTGALPPDGFGTRLTCLTGGVTQSTWVDGGCNFSSQNELAAHFGLGPATTIDELNVYWPDGRVSTLTDVASNQEITIRPPGTLMVSFSGNTDVPGVGTAGKQDIVGYDLASGSWRMIFDGSDVGLDTVGIDAFAYVDGPTPGLLLSFAQPADIAGLVGGPGGGIKVDDSDVVLFTPTSLGDVTSGEFSFYFDGSDVDLTTAGEDIDALAIASDGSLLISVMGTANVAGLEGVRDEDVMAFAPATLGEATTGAWSMYFDGGDMGFGDLADEDVDAVTQDATGALYLSTLGDAFGAGVSAPNEDIIRFTPLTFGAATNGSLDVIWDLSTMGIDPAADVGGLEFTTVSFDDGDSDRADINLDGRVDQRDVLAFLAAVQSADPAADFNKDGLVDIFDLLEFQSVHGASGESAGR